MFPDPNTEYCMVTSQSAASGSRVRNLRILYAFGLTTDFTNADCNVDGAVIWNMDLFHAEVKG